MDALQLRRLLERMGALCKTGEVHGHLRNRVVAGKGDIGLLHFGGPGARLGHGVKGCLAATIREADG